MKSLEGNRWYTTHSKICPEKNLVFCQNYGNWYSAGWPPRETGTHARLHFFVYKTKIEMWRKIDPLRRPSAQKVLIIWTKYIYSPAKGEST